MSCLQKTIILALWCLWAHNSALSHPPEFAAPAGKVTLNRLLGTTKPEHELPADKVALAEEFLSESGNKTFRLKRGCSATFISNTGHAVTSLHCLRGRPFGSLNNSETLISENLTSQDGLSKVYFSRSNPAVLNKTYGPFNTNDSDLPPGSSVTILDMGSGYINLSPSEFDLSMLSDDGFLTEISKHSEDYAIIKISDMPTNAKCTKISLKESQANELTWVAGYPTGIRPTFVSGPSKAYRPPFMGMVKLKAQDNKIVQSAFREFMDKVNLLPEDVRRRIDKSFDSPFFISIGRYFKNFSAATNKYVLEQTLSPKISEAIYPDDKYFVSTALAGGGMSGGGAFNTDGDLIGVTAASIPPKLGQIYSHGLSPMSVFLSINHIRTVVAEKLGVVKAEEFFNCH